MTLLTGRAIDWAAAVWETDLQLRTSIDYLIQQLCEIFEYPVGGQNISTQLLKVLQGSRTAAEYAVEFRTLKSGFIYKWFSTKPQPRTPVGTSF